MDRYRDQCRFTMDLSMIEQKVDPRNPKGSCQRLLKEFTTLLRGARGRVWLGSEDMRERFQVAKEELVKTLVGTKLGGELERIAVEISKVRRIVSFFLPLVRWLICSTFPSFPLAALDTDTYIFGMGLSISGGLRRSLLGEELEGDVEDLVSDAFARFLLCQSH